MEDHTRRELTKLAGLGAFGGLMYAEELFPTQSFEEELENITDEYSPRDKLSIMWGEHMKETLEDYSSDEKISSEDLSKLFIPPDYQDFIQPDVPEINRGRRPGERLIEKKLDYEADVIESFQKPEKTEITGKGDCEDLAFHQGSATDKLGLDYRIVFGIAPNDQGHALLEFKDLDGKKYFIPASQSNEDEPNKHEELETYDWEPLMYFNADTEMKKYSEDFFQENFNQ